MPAASEFDQLAYADLVLRRLGSECPDATIGMLRAVEFEARIQLRRPVALQRNSAFEISGPRVLVAPRTRRSIELIASAAGEPMPALVPFVSAASSRSVTIAAAPQSGCSVSATVAERAMAMHWLAPWGRWEIESVATQSPSACQQTLECGHVPLSGREEGDRPVGYLVFAGEDDVVDPGHTHWGGARIGVVRSTPVRAPVATEELSSRTERISVGDVEYVLVDQCP